MASGGIRKRCNEWWQLALKPSTGKVSVEAYLCAGASPALPTDYKLKNKFIMAEEIMKGGYKMVKPMIPFMIPIKVPMLDETAEYECWLAPGGLIAFFKVSIDRGWTCYQSDYDSQPEDICQYENIDVKVDGVYDYDGNEVHLCPTIIKEIENKLIAHVPSYK